MTNEPGVSAGGIGHGGQCVRNAGLNSVHSLGMSHRLPNGTRQGDASVVGKNFDCGFSGWAWARDCIADQVMARDCRSAGGKLHHVFASAENTHDCCGAGEINHVNNAAGNVLD